MLDTSLAVRYATALYGAAKKQDSVLTVLEEIESFAGVLSRDLMLKRFFLHPAISSVEKKALLDELVGNRLSKLCVSFISILIDAQRMDYLELIKDNLVTIDNHEKNKVKAVVASVFPLPPELQRRVKESISVYLKKDVDVEFSSNPDLLGGIKIAIEDRVIDGSVLNNLKKLENKIALG
jgi:ATP synthase F1 delta subunit